MRHKYITRLNQKIPKDKGNIVNQKQEKTSRAKQNYLRYHFYRIIRGRNFRMHKIWRSNESHVCPMTRKIILQFITKIRDSPNHSYNQRSNFFKSKLYTGWTKKMLSVEGVFATGRECEILNIYPELRNLYTSILLTIWDQNELSANYPPPLSLVPFSLPSEFPPVQSWWWIRNCSNFFSTYSSKLIDQHSSISLPPLQDSFSYEIFPHKSTTCFTEYLFSKWKNGYIWITSINSLTWILSQAINNFSSTQLMNIEVQDTTTSS